MKPEELAGEFRGGRLVRLSAKSDADRDWLSRYLASIPNGDRLGESARRFDLAHRSHRVRRVDRLRRPGASTTTPFWTRTPRRTWRSAPASPRRGTVPIGRARHGVNRSGTHIDVTIGIDDLEATGVTAKGRRVTLRDGRWQI